ncbi:hypothetical protein NDU88_007523 [Pleurodeles waltl]|uniref:Uncharacterized protein n=1 Tax=Pleurodeles waltl TaxID=8319 RepID=A0AAV7MG07_PLEWA|nr:hypothetical protein NDU88_007523 [Pleurodeles waltl]
MHAHLGDVWIARSVYAHTPRGRVDSPSGDARTPRGCVDSPVGDARTPRGRVDSPVRRCTHTSGTCG